MIIACMSNVYHNQVELLVATKFQPTSTLGWLDFPSTHNGSVVAVFSTRCQDPHHLRHDDNNHDLKLCHYSKEWVLTAAHCTHGAVSSYAYLGAHNLYSEEEGRLIIFTQVCTNYHYLHHQ